MLKEHTLHSSQYVTIGCREIDCANIGKRSEAAKLLFQ